MKKIEPKTLKLEETSAIRKHLFTYLILYVMFPIYFIVYFSAFKFFPTLIRDALYFLMFLIFAASMIALIVVPYFTLQYLHKRKVGLLWVKNITLRLMVLSFLVNTLLIIVFVFSINIGCEANHIGDMCGFPFGTIFLPSSILVVIVYLLISKFIAGRWARVD